ncbi:hypothetical protein [Phytohabitans houttuyneae]|uniref:Uncharacterized protein n=1 Tax=Phytohabitans houttuyneae TaxID=1076126 RepID=A0A6V8KK13_9ACTN|nr:hypothetical protein [Phytohabitans houttuyneae]GFJ82087.1 hypothetical protein Phou_062670 [Phytohabitans houttuyneae]
MGIMAEKGSSIAAIPLSEVLQRNYPAAEGDLRRLGIAMDNHRPAAGRSQWHWYLQSAADPQPSTDRIHNNLLLDAAIKMYDTGVDWLELTLYIAWGPSLPNLIVNAAVEVACWCPHDHNAVFVLILNAAQQMLVVGRAGVASRRLLSRPAAITVARTSSPSASSMTAPDGGCLTNRARAGNGGCGHDGVLLRASGACGIRVHRLGPSA